MPLLELRKADGSYVPAAGNDDGELLVAGIASGGGGGSGEPFRVNAGFMQRNNTNTAYSIGDSISEDAATVGNILPHPVVIGGEVNDILDLRGGQMTCGDILFVGFSFRVRLFRADPTLSSGVSGFDNLAYAQKMANWVGDLCGIFQTGTDIMRAQLYPETDLGMVPVEQDGDRLWWQVQALVNSPAPNNSATAAIRRWELELFGYRLGAAV